VLPARRRRCRKVLLVGGVVVLLAAAVGIGALLNGITRAVAVAAATTVWSGLNSKASRNTMSPSRWTTPPLPTSRPGLTGRRKLTLSCKVV